MPQATLTTYDALLKEVYGPQVQDQLMDETTITKRIERTKEGVVERAGGKYVDFPIHTGRNHGVGSRKENEQIPNAKMQQFAEVHVPLTYTYGVVRLTGQLLELAETDSQAFASTMTTEMEGIKDDLVFDWERQVLGDGTGLLASVTADPGANQATVDSVDGLEIGMQIDIRTRANGAAVISDREITDINGLVVTYDGADGAVTAAEGLYRQGNFANGISRELSGFGSIFSATSTLHTVNPGVAAGRKWAANVNANGGVPRALSEGLMIKMIDDIRKAGGGRTSVIFTSMGVRRAYFNLLVQQRRFTDTKKYAGGMEGLSFMHGRDVPVVDVVQAPPGKMFFVDESKLKIFRNKDWHWGDTDGSILKWVSQYDAWTAFMKQYAELGTTQRNAMGVISDLIEG